MTRWQPQIRTTIAKPKEECDHEWQTHKKTIHPDNDRFPSMAERPYFKVKACHKCRTVHYLDYKTHIRRDV